MKKTLAHHTHTHTHTHSLSLSLSLFASLFFGLADNLEACRLGNYPHYWRSPGPAHHHHQFTYQVSPRTDDPATNWDHPSIFFCSLLWAMGGWSHRQTGSSVCSLLLFFPLPPPPPTLPGGGGGGGQGRRLLMNPPSTTFSNCSQQNPFKLCNTYIHTFVADVPDWNNNVCLAGNS